MKAGDWFDVDHPRVEPPPSARLPGAFVLAGILTVVAMFVLSALSGCSSTTQEARLATAADSLRDTGAFLRGVTDPELRQASQCLNIMAEWIDDDFQLEQQKLCGSVGCAINAVEAIRKRGVTIDPMLDFGLSLAIAACGWAPPAPAPAPVTPVQ